jgi:hypothetical protein
MSAMIFINNKYTNWYNNIISSAKQRVNSGYTERHHIIPRSLGGSDLSSNLVNLTAREHFVCHWLLTKMVADKKHQYQMWNAIGSMIDRTNPYQKRYVGHSRKFELIRAQLSKQKSAKFSGENNPMYGKTHTPDAIEKIRKRHLGRVVSEETKLKCKLALKHTGPNYKLRGKNNAMYMDGVKEKREEIFIQKYGVSGPTLVPYKCEWCGKEGFGLGNYKRWHGDNCKELKR